MVNMFSWYENLYFVIVIYEALSSRLFHPHPSFLYVYVRACPCVCVCVCFPVCFFASSNVCLSTFDEVLPLPLPHISEMPNT